MRLRHKPWAADKLMQYPQYVIQNPEQHKGQWSKVFGNDHPLHIEVGTGKGQFIVGMAKANPEINYIGIELQNSVIVSALDRIIEEELPNVKLLNVDGEKLREFFEKGDVSRVYLNFSDPWPKNRHEKRRLTYKTFLKLYEDVLVDGGEIHFKTDNQGLFEYSLTSFSEYGLLLKYVSLDLHNSDYPDNIMTEYEEKFSARGQRIYRCEVKYPTNNREAE
ncbi:tRNA (guanosine(46)-N7)-methyltransferase TrmB [Heyndrickxia sporothermodurans]|uniref:tRNA (guanine-N(7)-)-methyltransferase n=1 Tax=Heyndrickxia sporothermodurans TaxID=46224 RepID=A0A150LFL7_9BACI|nr:tRNA (guanosine(46)-N7)-methyltransferase TrmB [Heyndrickxia sporothermodurans]KYD10736.1 tRNA (guanine46-N7-)-methyltransferase [Heyndrickxia sporothermodurans]MBL5768538.1 tRNA (guanosine(46)-N7)-methyltransferase TrmB [Heyndrickxia sporothermodurans]MBL5772222.1 tRNA (guanosine(46)-N7)-methyltransferase TrmB [Heyndrickxia sporothermodurans]MBL5775786.1 tRNA (guanosine(46)-N7)-methyltransferase TrmB [Heyndrickxia sporothermodurans]MBL5778471.1 tRNA (guanosine(46)-N7)-methyltransferase Trm